MDEHGQWPVGEIGLFLFFHLNYKTSFVLLHSVQVSNMAARRLLGTVSRLNSAADNVLR